MTVATPDQVVTSIVTLLRNNLTDPIDERSKRGANWIYDDQPRFDATFPRIWLFYLPASFRPGGQSNNPPEFLCTCTIQVQIITRVGSSIDVDGDDEGENVLEQLSYLGNQIVEIIRTNQATFKSGGLLHIIPREWYKPRKAGQFMYQDIDLEAEWENR